MSLRNGKEMRLTTPTPEPESPTSLAHLYALRLWVACALLIVGAGVANWFLNHFFPADGAPAATTAKK